MPSENVKFSDVKDNAWYVKAVVWATEKGIAKGTSETTFAPNDKISRQDMSVMLMNYVNYKKLTLEKRISLLNLLMKLI